MKNKLGSCSRDMAFSHTLATDKKNDQSDSLLRNMQLLSSTQRRSLQCRDDCVDMSALESVVRMLPRGGERVAAVTKVG